MPWCCAASWYVVFVLTIYYSNVFNCLASYFTPSIQDKFVLGGGKSKSLAGVDI